MADQIEIQRFFCYIWDMKQKIAIQQTLTHRSLFHPKMEDGLKILSCGIHDLRSFLQETSVHNPFLRYSSTRQGDTDPLNYLQRPKELREEIQPQIALCEEHLDEDLCAYLLSQLNSNGYFKVPLDVLIRRCRFPADQILHTIACLRRMEPVGCFCFTLQECLRVQCEQSEEAPSETGEILCDHLEAIAENDIRSIQEATRLPVDEIEEGIRFIRTLNPKPAANYTLGAAYLQAEAAIRIEQGTIQIELLQQDFRLELQEGMPPTEQLSDELRKLRTQAQQLLDHVRKRNLTMIQILQALCDLQKDHFLTQAPLRYCTMQMVADRCGLHVSTVSRAISGKSFLFQGAEHPIASLLRHDGNHALGATDIQQTLETIIRDEDPTHPYSDAALQRLLAKADIVLSRRTVAKYREACQIPCSSRRRQRT